MAGNSKPDTPIRETDDAARALAVRLIRTARFAALAALDPADGGPIVSRVATATALDGAPIILVSALSAHTRALIADPRCSLLLGEPGKGDPLAHPRLSLSCRARRLERESDEGRHARRRYLNRNPKGALYADFPDFAFFRLEPVGASLNGGFGKAYLLTPHDMMVSVPPEIAEIEQSAIVHMNTDHRDAVQRMAAAAAKRGEGWIVTGIDSAGVDLANGDETARIPFVTPVETAEGLRAKLVEMAKRPEK